MYAALNDCHEMIVMELAAMAGAREPVTHAYCP
jgi:hypothetical protein